MGRRIVLVRVILLRSRLFRIPRFRIFLLRFILVSILMFRILSLFRVEALLRRTLFLCVLCVFLLLWYKFRQPQSSSLHRSRSRLVFSRRIYSLQVGIAFMFHTIVLFSRS